MEEGEILLRTIMAMFLGGFVGFEREIAGKPAGIRTHMFVAGAATLLLLLSSEVIEQLSATNENIQADPTRVLEAIVVGISFIGAGIIFKSAEKQHVYYLTTASSILFTAAIGIAVALEMFATALALATITVVVSAGIGKLEDDHFKHRKK